MSRAPFRAREREVFGKNKPVIQVEREQEGLRNNPDERFPGWGAQDGMKAQPGEGASARRPGTRAPSGTPPAVQNRAPRSGAALSRSRRRRCDGLSIAPGGSQGSEGLESANESGAEKADFNYSVSCEAFDLRSSFHYYHYCIFLLSWIWL